MLSLAGSQTSSPSPRCCPTALPAPPLQLNLSGNQLTGAVPALELRRLDNLILHGNRLEGSLPALGGMPALVTVTLYDNRLTGKLWLIRCRTWACRAWACHA